MDRRGFMRGILAASMAPAIVKAENLMKIVVPNHDLILLEDTKWLVNGKVSFLAPLAPLGYEYVDDIALGMRARGQLIITDTIPIDSRLSPALIERRLEEHHAKMARDYAEERKDKLRKIQPREIEWPDPRKMW